MKKILLGAILLALPVAVPVPSMAEVNVGIGISLPFPVIEFRSPPDVIVMPDTQGVYVVPDIDVDMYFWNGWWWRPWEGGWYRSQYYNRGWNYYNSTPSFYYDVDPGWRTYYRERNWSGHRWDYQRVPQRQLQRNWKGWQKNRHWEKQKSWGVRDYRPRQKPQMRELRRQRQEQYQQKPEVHRHQQQRQQQRPEVQRQRQQKQQEQQQEQKKATAAP